MKKKGQATAEYILAFCALIVVVAALVRFANAARNAARETNSLMSSPYP
ncbi:MAG: hypothetical protein IIT98_02030 [Kiritimatiellae bacterium]|nr:hypothetical protein [Kiritimatiellia bacterium]